MTQIDNSRIAKNTVVLYGRTLFTLFVSFFTSRIILQALGVDNFGINSAVGGVIGMFSVVSGSLSRSISRFITFELGRNDEDKLHRIFCTAMNIQLLIGFVILILGETIGVWFLNTQMNIPIERMTAANWVLQCAIFSFFIGLTQTPYGACIVGHEKMTAFAYFNIVDTILKLVIVYLLYISPYDKLITYSILGFVVSLGMRIAQRIYCKINFKECHYNIIFDKNLMKEMTGFAGWSFLNTTAWIFTTQGVNILINIFFGVSFNAARGIASQIEGVVKRFVGDFGTAIHPQITKGVASGEQERLYQLICRGAKFSYFLLFCFSLPFMYEAYYFIYLWLGVVPEHTVNFFRLSIIGTMITLLGQTGVTACMATGDIKKYTIIMGSMSALVFPFTWILYRLGAPVESTYFIFILVYSACDFIRLKFLKDMIGFPPIMWIKDVLGVVITSSLVALIIPTLLVLVLPKTILSSATIFFTSFISAVIFVYLLGLNKNEKEFAINMVVKIFHKVKK